MKVIIISQKNEFSQNHIDKIRKYAEVVWIDKDETDLMKVRELFDPEEKIVALSPVPLGSNEAETNARICAAGHPA